MPTVPARLRDVEWDPGAFAHAIADVTAAIRALEEVMDDRVRRTGSSLATWEGASRDAFDSYEGELAGGHAATVADLEATRENLRTTREAIRAENARRASARDAWLSEQTGIPL